MLKLTLGHKSAGRRIQRNAAADFKCDVGNAVVSCLKKFLALVADNSRLEAN